MVHCSMEQRIGIGANDIDVVVEVVVVEEVVH
jgi:hypothetical protein